MRVIVLGGTRFIGRAIVEELAGAGHALLIAHRGNLEPDDLVPVRHLHAERKDLAAHRDELAAFKPDAAIDCRALTRADSPIAIDALPAGLRLVVISSLDDYDKLDVEDVYLPHGATSLRLPMVYGEHDYQLREEYILRRVRAGRHRIPFGAGMWLACRVYVKDMARGVHLVLKTPEAVGQVLNLCEDRTYSMRMWSRMILDAVGSDAELVRVADELLPEDLKATGTMRSTVRWHLAHPPPDPNDDFDADDRALASV